MTKVMVSHYLRPMAFLSRPTEAEFDQMLNELVGTFGLHGVAAIAGVPMMTLMGWRKNRHRPTAASKKTIWLIHKLVFKPSDLASAFDIATWGRYVSSGAERDRALASGIGS